MVAHRSYKGVPFDSMEIIRAITSSAAVTGIRLEKDAQRSIYISVAEPFTIICDNKRRGLGGLPIGSSGKAIVLLSGGIDSPVAAFCAMRRGLAPVYLHFHGFASNAEAASSKIAGIVSLLAGYSGSARIYYAPAYMFQSAAMRASSRYELVLFKRFMHAVAALVATREGAGAIVTGESLGQVASQTVENMIAAAPPASLFAMRPLIGADKEEIVSVAKRIGTYALSIKPYKDVCSIRSRHPATKARVDVVERIYESTGMRALEKKTLDISEVMCVSP